MHFLTMSGRYYRDFCNAYLNLDSSEKKKKTKLKINVHANGKQFLPW